MTNAAKLRAALKKPGAQGIALVRGYKKEAITLPNIRHDDNDQYDSAGELFPLFCVENELKGRTIVLYGDIIFETAVLEKLLKSPADISIVIDLAWFDQDQRNAQAAHMNPDLVSLAEPPGKSHSSRFVLSEGDHRVVKIGQQLPHKQAHGEFTGMAMFSEKGAQALRDCYRSVQEKFSGAGFHESGNFDKASFTDMIQELIDRGIRVDAIPIFKGWMEVDSFEEYQKAWAKIRQ